MQELSNSSVARQNILNNSFAVEEISKIVGLKGILFENEFKFTKKQVADFFEVSDRTIKRQITKNKEELAKNGYEVLVGNRLKNFNLVYSNFFVGDIDVPIISGRLGIFNFRTLLNIAMLLTDSVKARELRSVIIDIVIDTINKRTGGSTKYINQRDEDYIVNMLRGEDYHKEFTDALHGCVDMGNFKYLVFTDKVYKSIFKENASEYRRILNLEKDENVRHTMYSEVLDIITSYEIGFAEMLRKETQRLGRLLSPFEADKLFSTFEKQKLWEPLREKARNKMASRDLCFRDALHHNLEEYINAVPRADFDRFLGEKSMELDQRLEEYREALKRLKERN